MKWLLRGFLLLVLIALAASVAAAFWAWRFLHEPFRDYDGETTRRHRARYRRRGDPEPPGRRRRSAPRPAGPHVLDLPAGRSFTQRRRVSLQRALNTPEVLDKLIRGEVVTYPVTLIEG